jgi:hypothetical protein
VPVALVSLLGLVDALQLAPQAGAQVAKGAGR